MSLTSLKGEIFHKTGVRTVTVKRINDELEIITEFTDLKSHDKDKQSIIVPFTSTFNMLKLLENGGDVE